jgi:hypothetical protein
MRRHQRILLPGSRLIRVSGVTPEKKEEIEGVVTVIGFGGMFIRTPSELPIGTVLRVLLTDLITTLDAECTVRNFALNGFGVEFTRITRENEQKLKALLSSIKP